MDNLAIKRIISIVVAMLLMIVPLPAFAMPFWPNWMALVLFIWLMMNPKSFNLISVWCIGLLVDLLQGSVLGLHAMIYTAMAYVVIRWHRQIEHVSILQQSLLLAALIALSVVVINITHAIIGVQWSAWPLFSALTTGILWPWVRHLFNINWRNRNARA